MSSMQPRRAYWAVVASYLVALLLTVWPLPDWAEAFRPAWVVLVTVYWCLFLPHRVGVISAFVIGLLVDTLTGSLLGEHALALILVAWVILRLHLQLRVYTWWQQAVSVGLVMLLYTLIPFWADGVLGYTGHSSARWLPVAITACLWPWAMQVLARVQQRYQVG
ncbi:MAG TPA: rod shape-determining protein MreD [Gammaproteobacteria bacterium]|nr:rod shape-determining protein MreD [Gammaproteobacteria bacterium]